MALIPASSVQRCIERLLACSDIELTPVMRGANNRHYIATADGTEPVFVKEYHVDPRDPRDRLGTEYHALMEMRRFGIGRVPATIAADFKAHIGVYELILGNPTNESQITISDVETALSFIENLFVMSKQPRAAAFGMASEAVVSADMIATHLSQRMLDLRLSKRTDVHADMIDFLDLECVPALKAFIAQSHAIITSAGKTMNEVPRSYQTLSPCDFGFHNAIRTSHSDLVFVDFEYFGWDDPVKMVSDFLLHPAHQLGMPLKHRFMSGAHAIFSTDEMFSVRLRAMFPLFGIKWILILLNPFTDVGATRRQFAFRDAAVRSEKLATDLAFARSRLNALRHETASLING